MQGLSHRTSVRSVDPFVDPLEYMAETPAVPVGEIKPFDGMSEAFLKAAVVYRRELEMASGTSAGGCLTSRRHQRKVLSAIAS